MSERYGACIRIGGEIRHRRLVKLLKAIQLESVSHEWGEPPFEPKRAEELATAVRGDHLFMCDDQASSGEFAELESACRRLGLAYTRWCDGGRTYDAEVVDWRPGMRVPVVRVGSNYPDTIYVDAEEVRNALKHLEAGRAGKAKAMLRALCPHVAALPPFDIV